MFIPLYRGEPRRIPESDPDARILRQHRLNSFTRDPKPGERCMVVAAFIDDDGKPCRVCVNEVRHDQN